MPPTRRAAASFALSFALTLAPAPALAQEEERGGEEAKWHTVAGERHGISYFRTHRFPQVEYEPGETLTFDRYHTVDVMVHWMRKWADEHPEIVELHEVGRSFEGRPILQLTLTNEATGAATDKPAAFFEGGRHSGEITSSESVLWLAKHLIENYGKDPAITQLLDENAIYLRPQNNPDGSNLYLHTAQRNRSSVRPHDSDRDGLLDEDPEEDLDGDGIIYTIRRKAGPDEEGTHIIDPRDPQGRLMKRVARGEGDYILLSEGIDNDGDGDFNEDGIGGLDLHRNYPENWRPDRGGDRTGRGYTQFGAGAFPLSEPETRATVLFVLSNPNISVVNSMDTRVPMHLRPPSTSKSSERMYPEDLRYYERFDSIGVSITDYPWAGDVYETYATRRGANPITGDPARPNPLFGHGPDFGYFYFGAIWYGDELWNSGQHRDIDGDGEIDDYDALLWDDRENGGSGFREWESFTHPTLGEVEIGGFHPKFFSQNGPPHELERWAGRQARFNLRMALHLPRLRLDGVDVRRLAAHGDSTDYEIAVRWTNVGKLPTALRQAQLVKIVREDRVRLEFDDALMDRDDPKLRIIVPEVTDKVAYAGWTEPGASKSVTFRVRTYGIPGAEGTVHLLSTRGGAVEAPVRLGNPDVAVNR